MNHAATRRSLRLPCYQQSTSFSAKNDRKEEMGHDLSAMIRLSDGDGLSAIAPALGGRHK
ncbi:hypothetical protein QEH59_17470 [Coraliomargarita sp. SDUM461004]|uniref:Uncharacterized protein n=2 Tax=Thalassobacterium sedimentorum TaxID=3041258 RepID=A0ABU1AN54_9BACT|nr:hypothetical protein [Coraliomargarita sp. SDUM461004]